MSSPERTLPPFPDTPDPFEIGVMSAEGLAFNQANGMYSWTLDVWTAPAPDVRWSATDPIGQEDDLGPPMPRPQRDQRRAAREETRFVRLAAGEAAPNTVYELVRVTYVRPGYLARVATFLEVRVAGGAVLYLSNDLADPDPFPIQGLTVRWYLLRDDSVKSITEEPYLTAAPSTWIPSAHAAGGLPSVWEDMRYHWGQRPPNKVARLPRPTNVRLFAELLGDTSSLQIRLGGQLGGWEGQK